MRRRVQIALPIGSNQPRGNPLYAALIAIRKHLPVGGARLRVQHYLAVLVAIVAVAAVAGGAVAEEQVLDLELKQGRFTAAKNTVRVTQGDTVSLRITSDLNGEIHLHGYDVPMKVKAGKTTTTIVQVGVAGRFPITSHGFEGDTGHSHKHKALLYLEVYPR